MVYVKITGGIGNNLFQIAAAASLAKEFNTSLRVYYENLFSNGGNMISIMDLYKNTIFRHLEFITGLPDSAIIYDEQQYEYLYNKILYKDNIYLNGYFQNEKYFASEKFIQDLFAIDEDTYEYIYKKYGKLLEGEVIALNVRRGDYIRLPRTLPICSLFYYKKAIKYFGINKKFLVISDDIEWCKEKFSRMLPNAFFVPKENPIIHLCLQSLCTHNILSNSTFSWWGAYLNRNPNKIVVAPKRWYGRKAACRKNNKEVVPKKWIRFANPIPLRVFLKGIKYDLLDLRDKFRGVESYRG